MAQNVAISAIYLGNVPDIDTFEGNIRTENEAALLGTYGSAGDPLYNHVVTMDSDSPTQYIDADHDTGNGTLTYDTGSGTTTTGLDSMVSYFATVTFADNSTTDLALDIIQTTNGDLFAIAWDNSPILGSQAIQSISLNSVQYDAWGGFQQASFDSTTFVCFAPGTRILTPEGMCAVERLRTGDRVITADRGAMPLRWVGQRRLVFPSSPERQKPVEIKPGALGCGLPRRRLVVSPQHRVLLAGALVTAACGADTAFAPAHLLTRFPGIRRSHGCRRITYHSLLLDRHEVIYAEALPVESLHLGPMALDALSPVQRLQIAACGALQQRLAARLARPALRTADLRPWPRTAVRRGQVAAAQRIPPIQKAERFRARGAPYARHDLVG